MNGKTVLVVDDEADIRDALGMAISLMGYNVLLSDSRDQALLIIEKNLPDLIVLDWAMPGMSIEAFLARVEKFEPSPSIILCTAAYRAATKACELRLKYCLPKPVDLDVLERTIADSLKEREYRDHSLRARSITTS